MFELSRPTLLTVTWNTWESYTSRLIDQVFSFVDPTWYAEWIMVDSNSDDAEKIYKSMLTFPQKHKEKFTLVRSDMNMSDLPQYNRMIKEFVRSDTVVCISTDMRIFEDTIPWFALYLHFYDAVGMAGPALPKEHADKKVGGDWHWVPKLLVDRELDFDNTTHIQSHCIGLRTKPFRSVGGFWEPSDGNYLDKGHLITGEIMLSYKLRAAGYKLGLGAIPAFHYGNQMKDRELLDQFDTKANWPLPRRIVEV